MPKIFDNIENKLKEGLNRTLENAKRADFCIGYFNLKGWSQLYKQVDTLTGDSLPEENPEENNNDGKYYCRVLIGMQRHPFELLEEFSSKDENNTLDNSKVIEFKKKLAKEFKEQLTVGVPTNKADWNRNKQN